MAAIDVHQSDRGLQACFNGALLKPEWIEEYVKVHQVATLDDFVFMITATEWEVSLEAHVDKVPSLKGNRIAVARFKSAFTAGQEALKQAVSVTAKTEDLDEALPASTMQQLNADWGKRYSVTFDAVLEPSEQLRSRVYREFKRQTMTVIDAKKIRSVLSMSQPRPTDHIALPGGLQLQLEKEVSVSLRNVTDYYFALRLLCHAWAWAGNYLVSYQGEDVLMMDLSNALHYADTSLRDCMEYGSGSLTWYQRNDQLTRAKMATYVRRGYPAQTALVEALRQSHLEWRSPAIQPLVEPVESKALKRPTEPEPIERRVRGVKSDNFKTVSQIKGGARLCKPYNDGRGCRDKSCQALHACDVRMESGQACLSKKHTRLEHSAQE